MFYPVEVIPECFVVMISTRFGAYKMSLPIAFYQWRVVADFTVAVVVCCCSGFFVQLLLLLSQVDVLLAELMFRCCWSGGAAVIVVAVVGDLAHVYCCRPCC